MVISDPTNPQNEGKTFLYKFGKRIFDKVNGAMNPEFEDESPINPFDFWQGANFKLKVRKVAGFVNYDKSEFDSASELLGGDDAQLEEVWEKQYPLKEFTADSNFKNYEQLKKRFDMVVSGSGASVASAESVTVSSDEVASKFDTSNKSSSESVEEGNEGDDALSYFEKLANE